MKPKTKLPLAKVMWAPIKGIGYWICDIKCANDDLPCLVLPMPTLKSARARAKWENLREGERVERLANRLSEISNDPKPLKKCGLDECNTLMIMARACLAVVEGRTSWK